MANELDNRNEEMDENLEDDLIELVDEDGETTTFELLGSFELNGNQYLAVSEPTEEESEEPDSLEVFILKIVQDEDGNDQYVSVEDKEADAAFEHFLTLVDAEEE